MRRKSGGGNSSANVTPFGISYEMSLFPKGRTQKGSKEVNVYMVTTYYHFKLKLPKYLVEWLTNPNYSFNKRSEEVGKIRERIEKYYSQRYDVKVYKVQIDPLTETLLISGESNLPFESEALLELRRTTYALYAEWRDDVCEIYNLYSRYKRRLSLAA